VSSYDTDDLLYRVFIISLILTAAIVILMVFGVAAIKNLRTPPGKPKPSTLQQAIDACVEKGGIPIMGFEKMEGYSPDEVLKDCRMSLSENKASGNN